MDFKILPLREALDLPFESTASIAVQVLTCSEIQSYKNRQQEERRFFTVEVADSTASTDVRCYMLKHLENFKPGSNVLLQNLLRKSGEQPFWAISTTKVVQWANVVVPDNIKQAASNKTPTKSVTNLSEAPNATSPSNVIGKVLMASPLKYRKKGELAMKIVMVQDASDGPKVKMALFGDDAERDYNTGDVISVTDTYKWKETTTLSTKKSSKIEFLPSTHFAFESQVDECDDADFQADTHTSPEPQPFTVMGVQSAHVYQSCSFASCRNKKVNNNICSGCAKQQTSVQFYCSALLVVSREGFFSNVKLFKDDLFKLFTLPSLADMSNYDLQQAMLQQIPLNTRGIFSASGLSISTKKEAVKTKTFIL